MRLVANSGPLDLAVTEQHASRSVGRNAELSTWVWFLALTSDGEARSAIGALSRRVPKLC